MRWLVAVHCGAGFHSVENEQMYADCMISACKAAANALGDGCVDVVNDAVVSLENDACTNAGFGSNLTLDGRVEVDASVMDGSGYFGAIGAVPNLKNPIKIATKLLKESKAGPSKNGLIPPIFLVGDGAKIWGREHEVEVVDDESLITKESREKWEMYREVIDQGGIMHDTVGAVCIDSNGKLAAAASSGGIWMKRQGRVGSAGVFGCGVWANDLSESLSGVAVTCTGCGEDIIRSALASKIGKSMYDADCDPEEQLRTFFTNDPPQLLGALLLHVTEKDGLDKSNNKRKRIDDNEDLNVEVLWGHTAQSMAVAIYTNTMKEPQIIFSRRTATTGTKNKLDICGMRFDLKK